MNSNVLELALRKQRLQLANAHLRDQFSRHGAAFEPVFSMADCAADGARWLRRHPQILAAAVVGLLVVRPRRVLRWSSRAFVGWKAWQRLRGFLELEQPGR